MASSSSIDEVDAEPTIAADLEWTVVNGAFTDLFGKSMREAALSQVFGLNKRDAPTLLAPSSTNVVESPEARSAGTPAVVQTKQRSVITPADRCLLKVNVDGLTKHHYIKETMPPFRIFLTHMNGEALPKRVLESLSVSVNITVENRWAEVTSEVLKNSDLTHKLIMGSVTIDKLTFMDISLRHGGYFIITITPNSKQIMPYRSYRIYIQSIRNSASKKRKHPNKDQKEMMPTTDAKISGDVNSRTSERDNGSTTHAISPELLRPVPPAPPDE